MPSTVSILNNFKQITKIRNTKLLGDDRIWRMPIDHCWFCSLRVAASVISVYITVAYVIAFLTELWWVWDTGGQVPHLAYILITGYFVTFVLSAILVAGITNKKMPHLLLWLFGIVAILIPESGLVLYMSFHFWKIFSIYGLTEITCWACRLIVNVAGLICVYSLYFNWKEEQQVLTSLRDLNMATPVRAVENGRRMSVASMKSSIPPGSVAFTNQAFVSHPELPIQHQQPTPVLRRSMSVVSLPPMLHSLPPPQPFGNEFNASLFDTRLRSSLRSRSMLDLREVGRQKILSTPQPRPQYTRSLDRPSRRHRLQQQHQHHHHLPHSMGGFFPAVAGDRMSCGYFAVPVTGFLLDPHGKVAYVHDPTGSRTSLGSDDMHKYRDVAL